MSTVQPEQLYEADLYAWTREQAKELRRLARTRPERYGEMPAAALPAQCPYMLEQVLGEWLPGD